MHPLAPILCGIAPATLCALAHYFPWRFWFRRGRLPRPLAYVIGLLSILMPVTVAALVAVTTKEQVIGLLWLASFSAGAGTLACWWYDWHNRTELQRQREADREELYGE